MKKRNIIDVIVNIIITIAFIIAVYWFFQLLFGGSPDLSEFNSLLILMLAGILFNLYREVGEIKVEMKYFSHGVKNSFEKIRDDISSIKNDMSLIKKRLKV